MYNCCTQNLFKANEETYIKYISQALVKIQKKQRGLVNEEMCYLVCGNDGFCLSSVFSGSL